MELDVKAELARLYGIDVTATRPAVQGTVTHNIDVASDHGRLFLKIYPDGVDLRQEQAVLRLTQWLGDHGVPTPRIFPTQAGTLVGRTERQAFSLWEHVDGSAAGPLTGRLLRDIGGAVGTMHRELSSDRGYAGVVPTARRPEFDLALSRQSWQRLREDISRSDLDARRTEWLYEVCDDHLGRFGTLEALLRDHPPVTHQVTHGDLASPNVMVHQDQLRALIDFAPPVSRPVTYDLSRIGLDPRSVLSHANWRQDFLGFIEAYRASHSGAAAADLWASVRYGLIYVACSTYPFSRLVRGGKEADPSLWTYGRQRHGALCEIWPHLNDLEIAIRGLR